MNIHAKYLCMHWKWFRSGCINAPGLVALPFECFMPATVGAYSRPRECVALVCWKGSKTFDRVCVQVYAIACDCVSVIVCAGAYVRL